MRYKFRRYPLHKDGKFLAQSCDNCPRAILFAANNIRTKDIPDVLVKASNLLRFPVGMCGETITDTHYLAEPIQIEYQVSGTPLVTVVLLHPGMVSMVFKSNKHPDDVAYCAGFLADLLGTETRIVYVAPLTVSAYNESMPPRFSVHVVTLHCSGTRQEIVVSGVNTTLTTDVVHSGMRKLNAYHTSNIICPKPEWAVKPRCASCHYVAVCTEVDTNSITSISALAAL